MRFIIYGAGAIGSVLGGYLALSGSDVVLIGRPQHVAHIKEHGLSLEDRDGEHIIYLQAVESIEDISLDEGDVVFLCMKSQDTETAIAELKERASPELPIFCFQNGIRNEEIASQFFRNVYGVMVAIGGRYVAPGQVAHYANRAVTMGCYPQGLDERLESVGQALEAAGCNVTLSPKVMAVKWSKLIINLTNAFYAVTGLSIPDAHRSLESRTYLADVMEEGILVLEAAGIDHEALPGRVGVREDIEHLRQPEPIRPWPEDPDFHYYASTWQDLQLRRGTTEIASFNGEIVALGQQFGIPTPINELLQHLVKDMAANNEPPGKYSVAELRAMLS